MKYYWNTFIKEIVELLTILFMFLFLSGCSPENNPGDLSVAASGESILLTGTNNPTTHITAIYGSEYVHPDPIKSNIRAGNLNLVVSLFLILPQDSVWRPVGGGNGDIPWYYRLIYNSTEWLLYPFSYFAKQNSNGIYDLANKETFSWSFNGKNRTITIAKNTYPITAGDYVIVKLDKYWNPEVGIGEKSFNKLKIPSETRINILKCYMTIRKGIHALGKCK